MNIIAETTFEKARKAIQKTKKPIIFSSDDDELNKKIIEKIPMDILLINQFNRKDYFKQRNSGFNQVLAKIAKKNNISLGINLDEILESKGYQKAQILARIIQNVKLCNKNKIPIQFILQNKEYQKDKYDLKAFALTLGLTTNLTKKI